MEKLILIDGHSILSRAFYSVPDGTDSRGRHVNGAAGFLNRMVKLIEEEKPEYLAAALAEPKGEDGEKPIPQELDGQASLLKQALKGLGVCILEGKDCEARALLKAAALKAGEQGIFTEIVSADKRLLALAGEHVTVRLLNMSGEGVGGFGYTPQLIREQYGVEPEQMEDVLALSGEGRVSDGPFMGERTACALIKAYGSLENAWARREELRPAWAAALETAWEKAKAFKEQEAAGSLPELDLKAARLGDVLPEAAAALKELGLGEPLPGSESGDGPGEEEPEPKRDFKAVTALSQAKSAFKQAVGVQAVGLQFIPASQAAAQPEQLSFFVGGDGSLSAGKKAKEGELPLAALALCWAQDQVSCLMVGEEISASWLMEQASALCRGKKGEGVWLLDLKEQLPFLDIPDEALVYDAGVAGYLLNPLKSGYSYDTLAQDCLGLSLPSRTELVGKENLGDSLLGGNPKALECACLMAETARRLAGPLTKGLKEQGMERLYREIEMPLIYSLYRMEQAGVKVERQELKEYGDRLKVQIDRVEQEIYQDMGRKFNINSPKQLGEILFGELKLPGGKKTKTGYSTAADVLEKLAVQYPAVRKVLDYRQLAKLYSTYAEGLAAYIGSDGRIHGKFNQTITATGRISSTEPNLQNIPVRMELGREIRKVFVPEEGCVFVDADYSQIELRILAHMSGDERLVEAYQKAQDIHALTASQVFHIPLEEVTPLQRRSAKAVNFGIVYGLSAFGLSEDLSISRKEAEAYIEKYFETYPGVRTFLDGLVKQGKEQGYVATIFGRRRPIPELKSSNFNQRQFGERAAMNSPIQGTAADVMKIAMIRVDRELRRKGLKSRIVLQIHDELLVEAKKEELDQVKAILEEQMRHAASLRVELEVDAKTGDSWFAAK